METYNYNHLFIFTDAADSPELMNNFLKDAEEEYSFEAELVNLKVETLPSLHHALGEAEKKRFKVKKYQMGPGNC